MDKAEKLFLVKTIIEEIELPDYVYDKAKKRYESIGEFLEESELSVNDPHIFSQGSFRLGTVIKPINGDEEYDLDLACKLNKNFSSENRTQKELKELVGNELENYRKSNGIQEELESKHRCWRLEYQDDLSFHMDIVPAIPAQISSQNNIRDIIFEKGNIENLDEIVPNTLFITDDRDKNYDKISSEWNISNPEGYANWFQERSLTRKAETGIKMESKVDDLPFYKKKNPLQRSIQLMKRHRDNMFGDDDSKPISIIITTLAAKTYDGESNLLDALEKIIFNMEDFINREEPRVPNPVNPEEDFADKWSMEKYEHLNLEKNFHVWLEQIKADFNNLFDMRSADELQKFLSKKFAASIKSDILEKRLNFDSGKEKNKYKKLENPGKPWRDNYNE